MTHPRLASGSALLALSLFALWHAPGCGGSSGTAGQAGTTGNGGGGSAGTTSTAGTGGGAAGSGGATAGSGGGVAGHGGAGASGQGGGGTTGSAGQDGGASPDGSSAGAGGSDGGPTPMLSAGPCSPPVNANAPIVKLSDTGCMDATMPTKMAAIVQAYEINSPLWSDNADKFRGFALPANKKIHVKDCAATPAECPKGTQDDGKWVMPVGTVMIKSFGFDGKLLETRLLIKADTNTWNGYSYKWNEAQTEATVIAADELLPDNGNGNDTRVRAAFNTGKRTVNWIYPYRFDCGGCHTQPAGGSLGPETRQMNRTVSGMNQIDRWKTANLFETAPKTPYQAALALPYDGQLGTATGTAEQRARSYLHANCSYCHRPDGDAVNWLDFRYDTTLKATGACGIAPMKGEIGVAGAQILKPGKPMESTMWIRMNAPWKGDKVRMPQLATYVVDSAGLKVLSDWITATTTCPQ
jgi:uncharacterized repeat protein (TIGR03806 family)